MKKKTIWLLALLLFIAAQQLSAQNYLWIEQYSGQGDAYVMETTTDDDNNLILTGYFEDQIVLGNDTFYADSNYRSDAKQRQALSSPTRERRDQRS